MYYTRAQFARLLGVTVESLRYYEDCGILKVKYNEESRRYQYRDTDIVSVMNVRLFRAMNVPISSIKDFMSGRHAEPYASLLEQQIESARQQIKYLVELQDQMVAMRRRSSIAIARLDSIIEEERQSVYFFPLLSIPFKGELSLQLQEWMEALPFAWIGITIPPAGWKSTEETIQTTLALCISREYAGKYISRLESFPVLYKSCAHNYRSVIATDDLNSIHRQAIDRLKDYASSHGTRLTGTITGILLDQIWQENHFTYYIGISSDFEPI